MAKILIFTSHGGGGHISASNAIIEYLSPEHTVWAAALFKDVLRPLDPVRMLTLNRMHCEDAYNYFLKRKWTRALNLMCLVAIWTIPLTKKMISKKLIAYLDEHKPDLVISVIPIVNGVLNEVMQARGVPFIVIPTDLDSSTFIHNIKPKPHDSLFIGLAFNDPSLLKIADKAHLYAHQMGITGFPLKKNFFEQKDIANIKATFAIPDGKPVILMLMGAMGSQVIYNFAQKLTELDESFHLVICIGKNEGLRTKLAQLVPTSQVTITVVGFTDRISDLMAVSDLCITKAGSVSVCEALYMHKPLLLDCTAKSLLWEDFNINFIKSHGFGRSVRKLSRLQSLVTDYLRHPAKISITTNKIMQFKKDNFSLKLQQVIDTMLHKIS